MMGKDLGRWMFESQDQSKSEAENPGRRKMNGGNDSASPRQG